MAARYTELEWMTINKDFESKGVKLISEFTSTVNKHLFLCLNEGCGLEFESNFGNVKNNRYGCNPCRKLARGRNKNTVPEEIILVRKEKLMSRDIELLDDYVTSHGKYNWKCLKCDHRWIASFANVYSSGTTCARCARKFVSDQDIQDRLIKLRLKNIEMLDTYVGSNVKSRFKCLVIECNHTWEVDAGDVLRGKTGCARCKGKNRTEHEKLMSEQLNSLRKHMSNQYHRGRISTKSAKSEMFNQLKCYWFEQCKLIPNKPDKGFALDHIIPVIRFNFENFDQMLDCWNHKNLQWLTKSENSSKGSRLDPKYFTSWHYEVLNKMGVKITV